MCNAVAVGIVSGVGQAAGGIMQAKARHQAAVASAQSQTQINELNYQNQLNIAKQKDKLKLAQQQRQLQAYTAARDALSRQRELNQQEATRASVAAQQALREKITEVSFESIDNLSKKIQAQGTVLATQQSGQSMLLSLMDQERTLGLLSAQANASITDANKAYVLQQYGNKLDKYTADIMAINRLPGAPAAQSASFGPVRMPEASAPSGLGLMGGMFSAVAGGLGTGIDTASSFKTAWDKNITKSEPGEG